MGQAAGLIRAALGDWAPLREAASMAEAVALASRAAGPGDVVLLSPGCASFDMYDSYARRGDDFRREVLDLKSAQAGRPGKS